MKKILLLCLILCCYLQSLSAAVQEVFPVVDFSPGRRLVPLSADRPVAPWLDKTKGQHFIPRHFAQQAAEAQERGALGLHTYLTKDAQVANDVTAVNNLAPGVYDIYLFASLAIVDTSIGVRKSSKESLLMKDKDQVVRFTESVHVTHLPIFSSDQVFWLKFPEPSHSTFYVAEALFERTGDLPIGAVAARLAALDTKIDNILSTISSLLRTR